MGNDGQKNSDCAFGVSLKARNLRATILLLMIVSSLSAAQYSCGFVRKRARCQRDENQDERFSTNELIWKMRVGTTDLCRKREDGKRINESAESASQPRPHADLTFASERPPWAGAWQRRPNKRRARRKRTLHDDGPSSVGDFALLDGIVSRRLRVPNVNLQPPPPLSG